MRRPGARPSRTSRPTPLEWAAELVTRHPRLVLGAWILILGFLAMRGSGLEGRVSTDPVFVEGSETELAHDLAQREFGGDAAMVVVLQGPAGQVKAQSLVLAKRLEALPDTLVNTPWDRPRSIDGLQPRPGIAGLVVSVGDSAAASPGAATEKVERRVDRTVKEPVSADIAGGVPLGDALRSSIETAARSGEKLALPILLIVLLLVCRSFIAALMPVLVGAVVVAGTKGVLDICAGTVRVDSFALGAASMLGLALGVDYSLLVVSRFREERERDGDVSAAMQRTVLATGRSVIPAGSGLVLAMLVSSQLLPGAVVFSVALSVTAASVLSVLSAIFATPAILMVLGKHLDRFSLPRREGGTAGRWSRRLSSQPALIGVVAFVLFLSSAWAFTLDTSFGTVAELPPGQSSRVQHEAVQEALGPGWIAPLEVVMDANGGPVTTPDRLQALTAFQRQVEDDPGVASMAGFATLKRSGDQFRKIGPGLAKQERGIVRLDGGLARAEAGSARATDGFVSAHSGAEQISSALTETFKGSDGIADGLRATTQGSEKLSGGLERAGEGSGKLAAGAADSSNGAGRLATALGKAEERAGESKSSSRVLKNALLSGERSLDGLDDSVRASQEGLIAAREALQRMSSGRADPQYAAAVAAVDAASKSLNGGAVLSEEGEPSQAEEKIEHGRGQFDLGLYLTARLAKNGRKSEQGMEKLAKAARRLDRGMQKLASSSEDVSDGIADLAQGGEELSPGLRRLTASAERLTGGLGEIGAGAGELAGGLATGSQGSTELTSALGKLHSGTERLRGPSGKGQFAQLTEQSPGLFRSGYFLLAGLDGGGAERRSQVSFLVNLGDGGSAARMLIIPRYDPNTHEAQEARDRLRERADELARAADAEVLVGGVTPAVVDINDELRAQTPLARVALSLVTILILLFVTRSLILPLLAALLNLLTVSATFGLLALLFDNSLLGGPGYVDTVIIPGSIILIFGLAIDYEVFIFARMREEYLRTGSAATAISEGLARSANVVTGAALIMISVFLVFSLSEVTTLRVLGVGLAIAVFIDAFLIRFLIVPATMRALGERSWWIPRWLDRLLPGGARPAVEARAE
jgi:RND superfamily putative drug exporter